MLQQIGMGSPLDDPALVQDQDFVGMQQRAEPVSYDDSASVAYRCAQRGSHPLFGGRIDGGGGIIQYHDGPTRQQSTGNGHALALSPR